MTTCSACGLDGPCTDDDCEVRATGEHRCASCTAPHGSARAAEMCALIDEGLVFDD